MRQTERTHTGPDEKEISFTYNYDMSNGVRVDKTRLNLGGLETHSQFKYSDGDWLLSDRVGDALHTISYSYNGRGWLEEINSLESPPPHKLDDCDPPPCLTGRQASPFPPTKFPPCIEIGDIAIIQILYDCADLLAGDPTTVIVNIQTHEGQQTQSLPLNGSDGSETNQIYTLARRCQG